MSASSPAVLHYWSMKARGYPIAILARAAGIDLSWPHESEEASDKRLAEHQAAGILTFNQWPMLELDGKRIVQSGAIMRLLARRGGLAGDSEDEFILSETLMCEAEDMMQQLAKGFYDQVDRSNQAAYDKVFADWFPRHFGYLEALLPASGSGGAPFFKPGPKRLAGGYYLAAVLDMAVDVQPDCLDAFPRLAGFLKAMLALPEFAEREGRDVYFRRLG